MTEKTYWWVRYTRGIQVGLVLSERLPHRCLCPKNGPGGPYLDILKMMANKWIWYPCGVACSAGELVEMSSDLSGGELDGFEYVADHGGGGVGQRL